MGPQNNLEDERVRDVIFERNWHVGATGDELAIQLYGVLNVTIRNSLFDGSSSGSLIGAIGIQRRGIEPMPNAIRVYNNTFYNNRSGGGFVAVLATSAATDVTIKNNLAYVPNGTSPVLYSGGWGAGFSASSNSSNAQIKSTAPSWVRATPSVPADFALKPAGRVHGSASRC